MNNSHDPAVSPLLEAIDQEARPSQNERPGPRRERPCPIGGEAMTAPPEGDALANVCPEHGVWFEQDQWERFTSRRAHEPRPGGAAEAARSGARRPRGYTYPPDGDDLFEELFDLGGGD